MSSPWCFSFKKWDTLLYGPQDSLHGPHSLVLTQCSEIPERKDCLLHRIREYFFVWNCCYLLRRTKHLVPFKDGVCVIVWTIVFQIPATRTLCSRMSKAQAMLTVGWQAKQPSIPALHLLLSNCPIFRMRFSLSVREMSIWQLSPLDWAVDWGP